MTLVVDTDKSGAFQRQDSVWRRWVKADGSTEFAPETGRYRLYISLACPWACRCYAVRTLKGLEDAIPLTICHPVMERTRPDDPDDTHLGWVFKTDPKFPRSEEDPLGRKTVRQIYDDAGQESGRYSVPILWDSKLKTIVSNESSEIIQMLNSEFNAFAKNPTLDLYPKELRSKIDDVNDWVYSMVNNGVYRAGFAKEQEAYERAAKDVEDGINKAEAVLSTNRYLAGDRFTLADIRLFVTLARMDAVYVGHFKCTRSRLAGLHPNLTNYLHEIYQLPGIANTVDLEQIRYHYYTSQSSVNPSKVVANAPEFDFDQEHDRAKLAARAISL